MASDEGKRRGPGRRTDINWRDIQSAYESGETNVTKLAERFGVSTKQIARHVKSDKWATNVQIAEKVRSNVVDIQTRLTIDKMGGTKALEQRAQHEASELMLQPQVAAKLMEAADKTLDEFLAGDIEPSDKQNKADVLNAVATAVAKAFDAARVVHGLTSGKPSVRSGDEVEAEEIPADQVVLVVREKSA